MLRAEGRCDGRDHGGEDCAQVSPPQDSPKGENGSGNQVRLAVTDPLHVNSGTSGCTLPCLITIS